MIIIIVCRIYSRIVMIVAALSAGAITILSFSTSSPIGGSTCLTSTIAVIVAAITDVIIVAIIIVAAVVATATAATATSGII